MKMGQEHSPRRGTYRRRGNTRSAWCLNIKAREFSKTQATTMSNAATAK